MRPTAGFAALLAGTAAVSLSVIAAKQAFVEGADAQSLMGGRFLVAAPVVALFLPFALRAARRPLRPAPLLVALGAGMALWLGAWAEFEGLARLPAGMLVLLLATAPVWVAVLGWISTGRVSSPIERLALAMVVGGVAIMAAPIGSSISLVGVLLGLGGAISFAIFLLIVERNQRLPASLGFLLGMIGAAVAVLVTDPGTVGRLGDGAAWPLIVAIGVSGALWAVFVGQGVEATDAVKAAIVVAVEPVLVAVLAFVIFGEGLSARQIAGGAVVLLTVTAVAVEAGRGGEPSVPVG